MPIVERIISGGQTGVDQGALEAAIDQGVAHGGWCPRGRRTEDGVLPEKFCLIEHSSSTYIARTEANVRDSDATLILHCGRLSGGTARTLEFAVQHDRPHLVIDLCCTKSDQQVEQIRKWLARGFGEQPVVLNVAGARESQTPGIQSRAFELIKSVLSQLA